VLRTHSPSAILASSYLYSNASPVRFVDPDGRVAYDADHHRWLLQPGDTVARVARQTGFTVAQIMAAGRNGSVDWAHARGGEQVAIPQTYRIRTFQAAADQVGSTGWAYDKARGAFPANTNKCNLFVCEMVESSGARSPRYGHSPHWPYLAGTMGQDRELPALSRVKPGDEKIGDVAAIPHRYSDASGHALIYAGDVDIYKGGISLRQRSGLDQPAQPGEPAFISAHDDIVDLNPLSHYRSPTNPLRNDPIRYHRVKEP
jgi:hypothetical protein